MPSPRISLIAAIAEKNRAIGKDNKLLWHIPEDWKRFVALTTGHVIIMGLNTYRSIGKPLAGRTNIVLSHEDVDIPGCIVCRSPEETLAVAREKESEEIFIGGGQMVYTLFLPVADRLYLTLVKGDYEADTFFPDYSAFTKVVSREEKQDKKYQYAFVVLEK